MPTISVVTPCFNEERNIDLCYAAIRDLMTSHLASYDYEHLFIDNASTDGTVARLRAIAALDSRVKVIVNSRNFGPARSAYHAILQAEGDAIIPFVADLQTPAHVIPEMVAHWRNGAKAVLAIKKRVSQSPLRRAGQWLFYRLVRAVSNSEQIADFEGFGLYDRRLIDAMRDLNEPEPYFRGLIMEIGFERAFVMYDQPARANGKSSYSLYSLADFALLGFTTCSRIPLRMMTLIGFAGATFSLLAGLVYFIFKLLFWYSLPVGVAPMLIGFFFLGAIQLLAVGILGEYIGLLLNYSRRFPLVIERERINFKDAEPRAQTGAPSTQL